MKIRRKPSRRAERLVIVDGVRTPFSRMGTTLAGLGADELGRMAASALLTKTGLDPGVIDEVIFGCMGQPLDAVNVARVIAVRAGVPERTPAFTVSRNCASGCDAVTLAFQKMTAGQGSVYLVGGTESMSSYPLMFPGAAASKFARLNKARTIGQRLAALAAFRPSDFRPRVGLLLGLTDAVCGLGMGETAELIAREAGITREAQDAFAVESHRRAVAGRARLAEEIGPAYLPPDYAKVMTEDNGPRADASAERLARLNPVFDRRTGTITAGNASQVTDGAVALLVMSEQRAAELGFAPLGALSGFSYVGCDPARMGLAPLYAIAEAERRTGLKLEDADLIELNEAFAAQVLAVLQHAASADFARRELGRDRPLGEFPAEKLNVNGGALALGHALGASGARLILTALKELRRRGARRALVTLCVGGGQGAALWLESL